MRYTQESAHTMLLKLILNDELCATLTPDFSHPTAIYRTSPSRSGSFISSSVTMTSSIFGSGSLANTSTSWTWGTGAGRGCARGGGAVTREGLLGCCVDDVDQRWGPA